MKKRLMVMLLTLVMIFTVIPTNLVSVSAAENSAQDIIKALENNGAIKQQLTIDAGDLLQTMSNFSDVSKDSWYYDSVKYVKDNGIFSGVNANQFDPEGELTRAMFVTVLGRMAGVDASSYQSESEFSDVPKDEYYAPYVAWAKKHGITGGTGDGKFEPDIPVTRQEMATFFVRYFDAFDVEYDTGKKVDTTPDDIASVDSWAKDSVLKLWSAGLLNGDGKSFDPYSKATRAETAALCERTDKTVKVWYSEPDVPKVTEPEEEKNNNTATVPNRHGSNKMVYYKVTKHIGGETVEELVQARSLLSLVSVPTQEDNKIFIGWYYDENLTKPVKSDDVLLGDVEVYAKLDEVDLMDPSGKQNFITQENAPTNFEFKIKSATKPVLGKDFTFKNISSPERTDGKIDANALLPEETLTISGSNGLYTIKNTNGYTAGNTYQFELLNDDMIYDATLANGDVADEYIRFYNILVAKEEILDLQVNNGIKYINADQELSSLDKENVLAYAGLYTATFSEDGEATYYATEGNGSFAYTGGGIAVGDTVAVYTGTKPSDRTVLDDRDGKVAYLEITAKDSNTYYYKVAEAEDVLFTPDVLPIDIDAGDGVESRNGQSLVIDKDKLDFSGDEYKVMNLDSQTVVEAGDFIGFYTGEFGGSAQNAGYAKITSVTYSGDKATINYTAATEAEVLSAMDMFNEKELTEEEVEDALDKQKIEEAVNAQLLGSNFIQEAAQYLAEASLITEEVQEAFGADTTPEDLVIVYPDGRKFEDGDIHLMGNLFDTAEDSTIKVSVTITPKLEHFEKSTGVRIEITAKFEYDVQKKGNKNKLHLELTTLFEQEVLLGFTADGGAVWKKKWIFPYIADYEMNASVGIGSYTGIGITATAKLDEDEVDAGMPWPANDGAEWGTKKLFKLSESIKKASEKYKKVMAEAEGSHGGGLEDKYKDFMEDANDAWIDIFEFNIIDNSGTVDPFGILAYGVKVDFVVSANLNVALGISFSYEASKKHIVHISVMNKEAESESMDVGTNGYKFDFYVMGMMGIRAGVRAKVLVGLFSVKVDGIGIQAEAGLYAQFWGYFYLSITNFKMPVEQPDGTTKKEWVKEKSMSGAMLIEIGAYLDVNFVAEVLNGKYAWKPTLYSNQWPFLEIGQSENILDFAYEQSEDIYTQSMLKETLEVPTALFEMKYMDLKSGEVYGGEKDEEGNWSTSEEKGNRGTPLVPKDYMDLAKDKNKPITDYFHIEFDNNKFRYDTAKNQIVVNPGNSVKEETEMKIVFKGAPLAYTSNTPTRTVKIDWSDPEGVRYIEFNTNGGNQVKTLSGAGNEAITWPENPTKQGYVFAGWYKDEALRTPYTGSTTNLPGKNDKSFTLYAKWTPATDTPYKVEHYLRQLGSKKFDLVTDDTVILKGTTESIVTAQPNSYEGFTPVETAQGEVKANGSLVLQVYYERNKYNVTFKTSEDDENPTVFNLYYGANVSTPIVTKLGYLFDGWDKEVPVVTPANDSVFTATWVPDKDTPYRVEHYFERADKEGYNLNSFEEKQGETNTVLNVATLAKTDEAGMEFEKATVNAEETETATILADGTLVIKLYNKRALYDVKLDTKGGTAIPSMQVAYGKALTKPERTPEKQGYVFAGWYMDEAYTTGVRFGSDKMPADDITIYAKWSPADGVAYKVEHYLAELDGTYTKYEQDSLLSGRTDSAVDAIPATITGFAFDEENTNNIKTGKVAPDGSLVLKLYYSREYFEVEWLNHKDEVITTTSVIYGGSVTAPVVETTPRRTGYIFRGWNVPTEPMPATKVQAYAKWSPITYKVVFHSGLENAKTTEQTLTYAIDTNLSANSFENPGYVFAGWTDNTTNYGDGESVLNLCDVQDATYNLYAVWTPGKASYTIEHYKQNVSGEGYTLAETTAKTGTTEGETSAEAKNYAGFTPQTIEQKVIVGNGSTVVKVYYTRNSYKVIWKGADGNAVDTTSVLYEADIVKTQTVPVRTGYTFTGWALSELSMPNHDVEISSKWAPITYKVQFNTNFGENKVAGTQEISYDSSTALAANTIVRSGYKFSGWALTADGEIEYADSANVLNLSDAQDAVISLYAKWTPASGTKYVSKHYLQNVNNDEYTLYETNEHSGVTESMTNVIAHTYAGFTPGTISQKAISGDGTTEVAVYYTRNSYDILWLGYDGKPVATTSQKFESEITEPASVTPSRTGYTFAGWNIPDTTVPVGGISVSAKWSPITYKVQFRTNYGDNAVAGEQTITYDTTEALNLSTVKRTGYVFLGWSETPEGSVKYTDGYKVTNLASNANEVVTLYAVWQAGSGIKYISQHWQQNAENDEYTMYETEEHSGVTNSQTNVIAHTYAGFTSKNFDQTAISADGTTVVNVYYDRNSYDIKWLGYGGEVIETTRQKHGSKVVTPGKLPERTGYKFAGWNLIQTNVPIDGMSVPATWTPITYTVEFDANGSSGEMEAQTFTYDSDAELNANTFSKTGYVFVGWAETRDGEVKYSDCGIIHNLADSDGDIVTLYAVWQAGSSTKYISQHWQQNADDDEYTLIETDEHTGVTDKDTNVVAHKYSGFTAKEFEQVKIAGDESTVVDVYYDRNYYDIQWLDNNGNAVATTNQRFGTAIEETDEIPQRTGYAFESWNITDETVPVGGTSISANWTPNTYRIVFNANGGSGYMEDQTFTYDVDAAINANNFTWKGYDFAGWRVEQGENVFADGATVHNLASEQDAVVTLYAIWEPSKTTEYTVYHYQYDVSGDGYQLADTQVLTGVTDSMTLAQAYSYTGFTADSFSQEKISNLGDTEIKIYYRRNSYTVAFDTTEETSDVVYGGTYGKLPVLTRTGYTFKGWYTLENGAGSKIEEDTAAEITENQTLYPYFTVNYYDVTFNADGGNDVRAQSIAYGSLVTKPADPGKTGYTFLYWEADGAEYNFQTPVTGTLALKAVWKANTYTLTFDRQGGAVTNINSKAITYNEPYGTFPSDPYYPGYKLIGWFTEPVEGGMQVTEDTITDHASDRTVYARWSLKTYSIGYNVHADAVFEADKTYTVETDSFILPQPTRKGYLFAGWTGTGLSGAQKIVTIEKGSTGDRMYTATWTPIEYTVNFYSNSNVSSVVSQTFTYDTKANLKANTFAYTGYTYTGWNTAPGGSGTAYSDGAEVLNLTDVDGGVINLYAQWNLNSYTVQFVDHDGRVIKSDTINHFDGATAPANPSRTGYTFTGWDKTFDEITGPTTINATYSANSYKFSTGIEQQFKMEGDGTNYASISGMGTSGQLVYDQTYTIVPEAASGYTYDGYTINGVRYDKNASKSFTMNYTSDVAITVHFVRNAYSAQTSYYEVEPFYWTSALCGKGIELTVHWSNNTTTMQSDSDLAKSEDSRYYTPPSYGIYPKEVSWWITGGSYSNTLNWRVELVDVTGARKNIMSGSNKEKSGSMGTWTGQTATSIPKITVYGNNKMSFNLTTYGVNGAVNVTYTTNNSAVTASGKTITVDGSKFSDTQTVAIYANNKQVQTITIVKG